MNRFTLPLLLLAACGGHAAKPAATPEAAPTVEVAVPTDGAPNTRRDRRAEPGVRAAAKPLAIAKGTPKCGKLGAVAAADAELLEGRLKVRAPGKAPEALPDAPPVAEESRLVATAKGMSLAVVARETFQLDPDLYEAADGKVATLDIEAPKFLKATFPTEEPMTVTPTTIGKLRAYVGRPAHPSAPPGKDTALVLAMLVAQDDGALESVAFFVRGETVRNATGGDLDGCTRVAERIAATIEPGSRQLDRAAGRREVAQVSNEEVLALTVPSDWVVVRGQEGAHLTKLRPLSLYQGSIHITVGAAGPAPEGADTVASGKLLGKPVEWRGRTTPKGGFLYATEPLEANGKTAAVLVKATRQQKALDEMRGVAETLAVVKR